MKLSPRALTSTLSRRAFLKAGAVCASLAALPNTLSRAGTTGRNRSEWELTAAPFKISLVGEGYPDTEAWCFDKSVPGPAIRARQGDRLRVRVTNGLEQETTVHWHGIRLPNAMDGVPHLTQPPIAPGDSFVYEFDLPDAGTYWYHPHQRSFEQVGRGLYGALIVEEGDPPQVDRDLVWVLDDWRLDKDARITGDFANRHDMSHSGRIGNTVTVNGSIAKDFPVRAGERLRLRLINAANARIFGLHFEGHRPWIIAIDGQPVTPHHPPEDRVVLGPAMRIDLILDAAGRPDERHRVIDDFYPRFAYRLVDLAYDGAAPVREEPLDPPTMLPANTMPEPNLGQAKPHRIEFTGGMMGGMTGAFMDGQWRDIREMMHAGKMWAVNGVVATGHVMAPLLTLTRGDTYILDMVNDTAWHHPIHLHGHAFRVVSRNEKPTEHLEWQDTVLMAPREHVAIAFVADNPGDWMFHCHILEHQAGGMTGVIRVTDDSART